MCYAGHHVAAPRMTAASHLRRHLLSAIVLLSAGRAGALTHTTLFPANGATNVCPDTPLKITFDATPVAGLTGAARIYKADGTLVETVDLALNAANGTQPRTISGTVYNAFPVLASDVTATIVPRNGALAYNTTYYVTIDAGMFNGHAGVTGPTAWRFTTRASAPAAGSAHLIVAADGTGDFCTVQGAVDYVPAGNTTRRYINIRNGTYAEIVRVSSRHNLAFRGQHRRRTVLSYVNNSNLNASTNTRPLFNLVANDISFDNLTLLNATPPGGSQAEALRVNGARCVLNNCDLSSYQDTFLVNSAADSAYFVNCRVEGSVDFIWGAGRAVFQRCEIKSLANGYVCQMRNPAGQTGAVFLDCRFTRLPAVNNVVLARVDPNTYPASQVSLVDCSLDAHITAAGWLLNAAGPVDALRFEEYRSTTPAGGVIDVSGRAAFSRQLNAAEAATLRNISGLFGGWTPVPPLPAFPGAEGAGANALGGRGGDVYAVTSLADSGAGTLRDAVTTAPAAGRTVVFKVSGNIELASNLTLTKPRVTIAGQTAPGGGICLKNYTLRLDADDVVVRHLRSRLGTDAAREDDAVTVWGGINVMVDHCSASWSVDEVLSVTDTADNVTLQWCMITEALHDSIHSKGPHGYGSLLAGRLPARYSLHHNLYAHNQSRNPRPGSLDGTTLSFDFRNNVIYNWGFFAGYSAASPEACDMNYVGNYLVKGPGSTTDSAFRGGDTTTVIFQQGNRLDLNRNAVFDGTDTGWGMFSGTYTQRTEAFDFAQVNTTDTAAVALQRVLSGAGARPWARDTKDAAIAGHVVSGTGGFVSSTIEAGGYPTLTSTTPPVDTDNDGMPDFWEVAMGGNASTADHNGDTNGNGYTNLEEYLHWQAEPHAFTPVNVPVDVDLTALNGSRAGLAYTVAGAQNGTAALLPGGVSARFTPATDAQGLGGFDFIYTSAGATITQRVAVVMTPGLSKSITWAGATSAWDLGVTPNFKTGPASVTFAAGDQVTFDDSGVTGAVVLSGVLMPSAMTVTGGKDYSFAGPGSLAGSVRIDKTGAGKLTLSGANTHSGGVSATGGTLELGHASGAGTGTISLDGTTLNLSVIAPANVVSATGACAVSGSTGAKLGKLTGDAAVLLKVTSGVLDLGGDLSEFNGALTIDGSGTVRFTGSAGGPDAAFHLGSAAGAMSVRLTAPLVRMGSLEGGPDTTLRGHSNVNVPMTFEIGGRDSDTVFSGRLLNGAGGAAATVALRKVGAGALTLAGANAHTGGTTVESGTLNLLGDQTGATGGLTLSPLNEATTTVNIGHAAQTSATSAAFAAAAAVQAGSDGTAMNGFANQTLLVEGSPGFATTVTNAGSLLIGRSALMRVRTNAEWTQSGGLRIRGVGGYAATLAINADGTFTHSETAPAEITPDPANTGGATLAVSGGTYLTAGGCSFGASTSSGIGTFRMSTGGRLVLLREVPELFAGAASGRVDLGTGGGVIDTAGFRTTVSRGIANQSGQTGSLTKTGAGTLVLAGVNTYTGPTTVNDGTLLLSGSLAASATTVSGTGTLAGTGSAGAVTIASGGMLSPGTDGTGTLTTGALTLSAGGTARFEVGTASDRVNVTGALALNGNLLLVDAGGLRSGTHTLFTHTGAFSGAPTLTPPAGYAARLDTSTAGQVRVVLFANTFATWQLDHFTAPQLLDPAVSGPDATPAHDGRSNRLKYALGLSPWSATRPAMTFAPSGGAWHLTYPRPFSRSDLTYSVGMAGSLDAVDWPSAQVVHQRIAAGDLETWRASVTPGGVSNLFLRLVITGP